jgi:hypothetical protein
MDVSGKGGDQALALVGDAGSALGAGDIGILHGCGLSGDEGVLAVIDRVSIGVGEAQIASTGDAAIDREKWLRCNSWRRRFGIRRSLRVERWAAREG